MSEAKQKTKSSSKHPKRYAEKHNKKWSWHSAAKHLNVSIKVLKRDYEEYYDILREFIDGN